MRSCGRARQQERITNESDNKKRLLRVRGKLERKRL